MSARFWSTALVALVGLTACGGEPEENAPVPVTDPGREPEDERPTDDSTEPVVDPVTDPADPYADEVVSFTPGFGAGFGQDRFPSVVLGAPVGVGPDQGSLDVLSLGRSGSIVLRFTDTAVMDGPGVDLLVFENAFYVVTTGLNFTERGVVAVSDDGVTWHEFPCAFANAAGGYPGCAGVHTVQANPANGVSATDPAVAGGDGFDLATVGLSRARYVRIRDSGNNGYGGTSGGFDLDAVAVVNGVSLQGTTP
ncbi:cell surface protein [Pyxidicoccus xibeiensis]|uniref:cell surface protein n=1 Tax=Pyxidicoccus xibeiensis TaxID=2906759 RepID=UPI0020A7898A|nr:cell surface protein [Pyxidicoccus xibeiensis]MCP3139346.1 cell surface protein [Pyxidicoccus xibeiensis]